MKNTHTQTNKLFDKPCIQTISKQQTWPEWKKSSSWAWCKHTMSVCSSTSPDVCHLYSFVLPLREAPQRVEKVDAGALDELLLCLAKLLLSLSASEQRRSWTQNTQTTFQHVHIEEGKVESTLSVLTYTHHRVYWSQTPSQPGSSGLPKLHLHEAVVGRPSPGTHTAGPLTARLFIRDQRATFTFVKSHW